MKQNVVRLKDLNIPVRYFKLHNKKLRKIIVLKKTVKPNAQCINVSYSPDNQVKGTHLTLIIEGNKYRVQFIDNMWVKYRLPDKLKKLDAWLNLMGYTYESYIQRV